MIFLDHAATTPVRREALEAMWPLLTGAFGNPSSRHGLGDEASRALAAARADVAAVVGCRPGDVVFTSGAAKRYCARFAGTEKRNDARRLRRVDAASAACPAPAP